MSSATYVPDESGFRALAVGPELLAACMAVAERGRAYAEVISAPFSDTGEYAGSFDVQPAVTVVNRLPRASARLENTAPHAAAVEWGNENVPNPHRPLGRTLDHLERPR